MEIPSENHWIRRIGMLAISALLVGVLGWSLRHVDAEQQKKPPGEGVVATVGDIVLMETDLEAAAVERLEAVELSFLQAKAEYRKNRHQALQQALDEVIQGHLLDLEAKEKGVTPESLIEDAVTSRLPPVTEAEVDAFYLKSQKRDPNLASKEAVAERIRSYLQARNQQVLLREYYGDLAEKYDVEIYYEAPRVEIATKGFPSLGPEDGPVTIVEFSDFQCPYCSKVVPSLHKIHEEYPDQVRVVFRQYPLPNHRHAQKAAEASLCAQDQGRFWEMHDSLFENQKNLGLDQIKSLAAELDLDEAAFATCLESGVHADQIQADLRDGAMAGVSGTPAIFVNGKALGGAVPYEDLVKAVEAELL